VQCQLSGEGGTVKGSQCHCILFSPFSPCSLWSTQVDREMVCLIVILGGGSFSSVLARHCRGNLAPSGGCGSRSPV
jgi:hypothetical protein